MDGIPLRSPDDHEHQGYDQVITTQQDLLPEQFQYLPVEENDFQHQRRPHEQTQHWPKQYANNRQGENPHCPPSHQNLHRHHPQASHFRQYQRGVSLPPTPPRHQQFFAPPSSQLQQNTNIVVISGQEEHFVVPMQRLYSAFTPALILACVVFWCCGMIFGGVAFIIAIFGQNRVVQSDESGARWRLGASYGISIAGIALGLIVILTIVLVLTLAPK